MKLVKSLTAIVVVLGLCATVSAQARSQTGRALDRTLPEINFSEVALTDAIEFLRDVSGANIHVNWRALEMIGVSRDTTVNARLRNVTLRRTLQIILSEAGAGELSYTLDDGVIQITTRDLAERRMYTKVYPVEDLLMEVPSFEAPAFNLDSNTTAGRGGQGGQGGRGGRDGGYGGGGGVGGGGLFSGGGGGGTDRRGEEEGRTRAEKAEDLVELIMDVIEPEIWREYGGPASIRYFNGTLIVTAPRHVHEMIGGPLGD